MHSDRDALLAGIVADPDADLPRLVFADWLEETGHPANCARAEYIRLAIAHGQDRPRTRVVPRWLGRLTELRTMFRDEWDECRECNPEIASVVVGYARGFVATADVPIDVMPDCVVELNDVHPIVSLTVGAAKSGETVEDLSRVFHRSEDWRISLKLRSLAFRNVERVWPTLAGLACPIGIRQIKHYGLVRCALTDEGLVSLIAEVRGWSGRQELEVFDLSRNLLTDFAAHTLAAADWPPTLRRLNIDGNRITNAGREVLFRRFGFEELRPRLALG